MQLKRSGTALAGLLMLFSWRAWALDMPAQIEACAAIPVDQERLACYDRIAAATSAQGLEREDAAAAAAAAPSANGAKLAAAQERSGESSILAEHWELGAENKRGTFKFRPHHDTYLIATYTPSPNNTPYLPFRSLTPEAGNLSQWELAFQLGFKMKLAENVLHTPADLWFGYTQRSFWQAASPKASSPFRETDYQPEVMAVIPTDLHLLGLRMRFVNLGFVHQSNGQASTLSRSWNRVYAQAGFERGNFTLVGRVWKRFNEDPAEDDNPDIVDYIGRGDLVGTYRWNGHELSVLGRYNFHTAKGAAEIGWKFPLTPHLKGYVQLFTGYGYTLIDYNDYQNVLGMGLSISY